MEMLAAIELIEAASQQRAKRGLACMEYRFEYSRAEFSFLSSSTMSKTRQPLESRNRASIFIQAPRGSLSALKVV